MKVTVELRESRGRWENRGQREVCTVKLLGWFAEDITLDSFPQDTCAQPVPVDVGQHMLDPAALAHVSPRTPDYTTATSVIPN